MGIRAAGNAIPPPMAAAIVRCALRAAGLEAPPAAAPPALPPDAKAPLPPALANVPHVSHAKYRALKRRVEMLEHAMLARVPVTR